MADTPHSPLATFLTPFRRQEITLRERDDPLTGDVRLLEMRIREGRRFTLLELDAATAQALAEALAQWAKDASAAPQPPASDTATD